MNPRSNSKLKPWIAYCPECLDVVGQSSDFLDNEEDGASMVLGEECEPCRNGYRYESSEEESNDDEI